LVEIAAGLASLLVFSSSISSSYIRLQNASSSPSPGLLLIFIPTFTMEKPYQSSQSNSILNDDASVARKDTSDPSTDSPLPQTLDTEKQQCTPCTGPALNESAFKGLGILDRFLAVWILLAMAIGIILGNFVPNTGPALQKGKFAEVSIPIGNPQIIPRV
jgi:hypothetical protein